MVKQIRRYLNNFDGAILFLDFIRTAFVYMMATCFALLLNQASVLNDNIFGIYMLGVAVISFLTTGYLWGILASIGGVVGVNFFFTYPYFSLNFSITGYPVTFSIMLLMSILVSFLTAKVKRTAAISAEEKKKAETLNEIGTAMLIAQDVDTILDTALVAYHQANQCSVILYLGSPMAPTKRLIQADQPMEEQILTSMLETQVAFRVFTEGKPGGAEIASGTQNCKGTYFPIATKEKIYGVVGLLFDDTKWIMDSTYSFINVLISQIILALERLSANEKAQEILLETEKEKMRSNLLRAVSHDLRTPLTGIIGSASTLLENGEEIGRDTSRQMLSDIRNDAEWLIHMVENLLSVTRISGGTTTLQKQEEIVEEVVGEAVGRIRKRFPGSCIDVQVPEELLIVPMDATLIEQVLINLMENAIRHSGSDHPIGLRVAHKKSGAVFTISDHGKGIDPSRIPDIFDGKPQNGSSDSTRGIGIGLSICKSIILAHDGKIFAKNNKNGGASFSFVLPMKGDEDYAESH